MNARPLIYLLALAAVSGVCGETPKPLNVGPVALNATVYESAAKVTANALGSGVNGPQTAQTGLTVNISKDNWWTGGKTGEIDGVDVMLRQNAPGSDASGILIQNSSPAASWQYALRYQKNGSTKFSVDGPETSPVQVPDLILS